MVIVSGHIVVDPRHRHVDGTPPDSAVFDEVVAQLNMARMQPGATIAVFADPQNPADMAIDWIRTSQL